MHSSYSTVGRLLIIATVATFGDGQTNYKRNLMQIGVHITYNHEIQEIFERERRDPNYYFTVLLNAVETRLATISDVTIELTLVGTNFINKSESIEDSHMDKKDILNSFKKYYTSKKFKLGCPDVTFYVTILAPMIDTAPKQNMRSATGRTLPPHRKKGEQATPPTPWPPRAYFMEQARDEGSWLYTAKIGGICGNESVGMFYDDGKTFFGVHALSREMAFLIGATRDNETHGVCARKNAYLTSFLDDTTTFRLSPCAKNGVHRFFLKNQDYNCWNDTPKPIMRNNWTLPAQYLEEYLTDGRVDLCKDQLFYFDLETCSKRYTTDRKSLSCRVFCCDEDTTVRSGYVVEPDGRYCGFLGHKMCIHGECVPFS
uniref:Putative metalloprotease n=1 Tax=Ixodes ricinus TaxID=34613 RepID=A0A6B0VB76_IXORI